MKQAIKIGLAIAFLYSFSASAQVGHPNDYIVHFCTEEPASGAAIIYEALNDKLSFLTVEAAYGCEKAKAPPKEKNIIKIFFAGDKKGDIVIDALLGDGRKSSRQIPWLHSTEAPLADTQNLGEIPALAILLENLALDFRYIELSSAPSFPEKDREQTPEKPRRTEKKPPDKKIEVETEAKAETEEPVLIRHAISPCVGAKWSSPDIFRMGAGLEYRLNLDSFVIVTMFHYDINSKWRFKDYDFDTYGLNLQLGAGYNFFQGDRLQLGMEFTGVWQYNDFKLGSAKNSETHNWSDFGMGVYLHGVYAFHNSFGLSFTVGAQVSPLFHKLSVNNSEEKPLGIISIPLTIGIDYTF